MIETKGLSVAFGPVQAVDQLDLEIRAGQVFGFLGPNGAGKSTTIRLLLGLATPGSGTATIGGFDTVTQGDDVRGQCGVLLDDVGLYDRLTAAENLDFAGRVWRMDTAARDTRTSELLENIGLSDRRDDRVSGWSLGMRKKLAVARAIYHRPPVLFLDEPTSGLDPMARRALREDIVSLARDNETTVFLTTHDLDDAERMCDDVGVMVEGRLIARGSPDQLRSRNRSSVVCLRGSRFEPSVIAAIEGLSAAASVQAVAGGIDVTLTDPGSETGPILAAAVAAGAGVEEVTRQDNSLEDIFVSLVASGTGGGQ